MNWQGNGPPDLDWKDKEAVRIYKAGYMRGRRSFVPNPKATDLANIVMYNDSVRRQKIEVTSTRRMHGRKKKPQLEGNETWQSLRFRRSDALAASSIK